MDKIRPQFRTRSGQPARLLGARNGVALIGLLASLASAPALAADWTLVPGESSLGFVSVKNTRIAEGHEFTGLSGSVTNAGAELVVDLASVDTLIEIRNQRMRELLFDVAQFPSAVFRADVDQAAVSALGVGESKRMEVSGTLDLHGASVPLTATLLVSRVAADRVSVASIRPVVISADAFALAPGITRLREIAGLESITPMVPVSFSLSFQSNSAQMGQ